MKYESLFHLRYSKFVVLLALALLIACCTRTQPVTYYQLSTLDADQTVVDTSAIGDSVIGVGPIRLPERLDRPQIVTRQSSNRLQLSDRHRWVEPLAENIPRVLRENLSVLLGTERFLFYPWSRTVSVDYQVIIDVIRFEGTGYETAHLKAIWSIQDIEGKVLLSQRRSNYQVTTTSPDHDGLVSALSETLSLLCQEIVQELSQMLS